MLEMNPEKRIDINEVLSHKFFTMVYPDKTPWEPVWDHISYPKRLSEMPLTPVDIPPPEPVIMDSILLKSNVWDLTKVIKENNFDSWKFQEDEWI